MMDSFFLFKSVFVLVIFAITLAVGAYSTYAERKGAAFLQDRLGPDRAGPFGILQPLADGLKVIMKEKNIPHVSKKFLFVLVSCIVVLTRLVAGGDVPGGYKM